MNKHVKILKSVLASTNYEVSCLMSDGFVENAQQSKQRLAKVASLKKRESALTAAIESLEQADNLAKVREYCDSEKSCGVLRSMDNTVRANTFQEILDYIDSLSGGDS